MVAPRTQSCLRANDLQMAFLLILPSIRRYGVIAFRHLRGDEHEDAVEETIANAYVAFARLLQRGRLDRAFPTALARFAVAQIRDGRKVGTPQNRRDVSSRHAQRKGHYVVERLDRFDRQQDEWTEALVEDWRTSVPDQVAFRIDFPVWLSQLSSRKRQVAQLLMIGNSIGEAARHARISSGRVSQLRHELYADWQRFHGEAEAPLASPERSRK
jgi:hypothetical protein